MKMSVGQLTAIEANLGKVVAGALFRGDATTGEPDNTGSDQTRGDFSLIRNGTFCMVQGRRSGRIVIFVDEAEAVRFQERIKKINTEAQAFRVKLYRDVFGDGAFGITDDAMLELV
ncbi:MAG: hypothetical protein AB7E55_31395 [Pigmentiphaga sp.]